MSNNNNNNDAFTIGDLIQNRKGELFMVLHQSVNNTYNGVVKHLQDLGATHRGWGANIYYDCGNYTRDRSNYYADLDVVKTKSTAKPNPRYGLTIIAPCNDVGEKRSFVWHEDCGRTQKTSMERHGFLPIGDERQAYRETVKHTRKKQKALGSYVEYLTDTGMLEDCALPKVQEMLEGKSIRLQFGIQMPRCLSYGEAQVRPPTNDATLEEMKTWVAHREESGEDANRWFGRFQKEWCSNFNFRSTFIPYQRWQEMFDGLTEFWSQRGRNYVHWDANRFFSSYNWSVLQEYQVWAFADTLRPHYEALVEALQGEGKVQEFFAKCDKICGGELSALAEKHGLADQDILRSDLRNGHAPDLRWVKDFPNEEQFLAYLDCDRDVFDEPTHYNKTAENFGKDYSFSYGHTFHRWHGEENWEVGEKIEKLIEHLGGEYSLWD